jgi:prepilin-type N-terminal cleavage/methylation domain-containing protein
MTRGLASDRGFTLIEVLVTLSILGLVVVALTSAFGFAQQVFVSMGQSADGLADIVALRRLLEDTLQQIENDESAPAVLIGSRQGFTVHALGPPILGAPGIVNLTIETPPVGGLAVAWLGAGEDRNAAALLHHTIARFGRAWFSYYSQRSGWVEAWRETPLWPAIVRLDFTRRSEGGPDFSLLLSTRALSPAICAVQTSGRKCTSE